jgi:hypothetical protein
MSVTGDHRTRPRSVSFAQDSVAAAAAVFVSCTVAGTACANDGWTSGGVLVTDQRIQTIRARLDAGHAPTVAYYDALLGGVARWKTDATQQPAEWFVPSFYDNQTAHRTAKKRLLHDTTAAYGLALAYRLSGDDTLAAASARYINAWSKNVSYNRTDQDTSLTFSYTFPGMIYAADLLRGSSSWAPADQAHFATFLPAVTAKLNTASASNNWGDWGNLLNIASAAYTHDKPKFDAAVARYKTFIADQIGPSGEMRHEVTRNNGVGEAGIGYSHFSIGPLAMTAEIARVSGVELYDYTSPNGRSLRQAWNKIAGWTDDPRSFPYFTGDVSQMTSVIFTDYDYFDVAQTDLTVVRNGYFELLQARWQLASAGRVIDTMTPYGTDAAAMQFLGLTHNGLALDTGVVPEPACVAVAVGAAGAGALLRRRRVAARP